MKHIHKLKLNMYIISVVSGHILVHMVSFNDSKMLFRMHKKKMWMFLRLFKLYSMKINLLHQVYYTELKKQKSTLFFLLIIQQMCLNLTLIFSTFSTFISHKWIIPMLWQHKSYTNVIVKKINLKILMNVYNTSLINICLNLNFIKCWLI
jgi:hypothetical protein